MSVLSTRLAQNAIASKLAKAIADQGGLTDTASRTQHTAEGQAWQARTEGVLPNAVVVKWLNAINDAPDHKAMYKLACAEFGL